MSINLLFILMRNKIKSARIILDNYLACYKLSNLTSITKKTKCAFFYVFHLKQLKH